MTRHRITADPTATPRYFGNLGVISCRDFCPRPNIRVMSGYRSDMGDPRRALDRLRAAPACCELGELCHRYEVSLLVAFGSTVRGERHPRDLDLAVIADSPDVVGLVDDLTDLAGLTAIDLTDLRRAGPVVKQRVFIHGEALFESEPHLFVAQQDCAVLDFMDTARTRRAALELLAR